MKNALWVALAALLLSACSVEVGDEALTFGSKDQAIQQAQITWPGYVGQAAIATSGETASSLGKSVGTLLPPANPGTWVDGSEGNCGATFITPHYAITAAHCLRDSSIGTLPSGAPNTSYLFRIRQVTLSNTVGTPFQNAVKAQAKVRYRSGQSAWPHWEREASMSSTYYAVQDHTCSLARRCNDGKNGQRYMCPTNIRHQVPTTQADIALVYCPGRQATASWTAVETADVEATNAGGDGRSIEVRWFHEVLELSTHNLTRGTIANNFAHYAFYDTDPEKPLAWRDNFHYRAPYATFDYFPIITRYSARNGDIGYPLEATGRMSPTLTYMNASVCHGTSGSGVFLMGGANGPRLLGPAVGTWGLAGLDNQLCDDFNKPPSDETMSFFTSQQFTQVIEALVVSDRP